MQYTLRNVPKDVDRALRSKARREGKTLNDATLEALADGLGLDQVPRRYRSVRDLLGARKPDPALDAALADQRRIDPELWK